MDRKRIEAFASIPHKANLVLYVVLIGFLIICMRLWHLSVVQHEVRVAEATHSRRHVVVEPATRGTIRDRFNIVLAANALEYRVGILWAPISEIPKKYQGYSLRKAYIHSFAQNIGAIIGMDPQRIEDVMYSYAVFTPTTPVMLKSGLTEREYYKLSLMTKDWPGLVVERSTKRVYPQRKSCCHVVGYTAAVSRKEYDRAVTELRDLRAYVDSIERGEDPPQGHLSYFAAKERLLFLERKAYSFNDEIGKMGVEAAFEHQLRGYSGKKIFITNAHGDVLREAVGSREPIPGQRLVLSISAELQEWCERLLAVSEEDRFMALEHDVDRLSKGAKNPFLRGGAIIAMDPHSGEVLTCASYPRFDPNDFVRSAPTLFSNVHRESIHRWIEDETYVRKVWDMSWPIIKEDIDVSGKWHNREKYMTFSDFIKTILPQHSPIRISSDSLLRDYIRLQDMIFSHSHEEQVSVADIIEKNPPYLREWFEGLSTKERFLLFDISRLVFRCEELPVLCLQSISPLTIEEIRMMTATKVTLSNTVRDVLQKAFRLGPFQQWRKEHELIFLREKRAIEALTKMPARPFLQYLDKEQSRQFSLWWKEYKDRLLLSILRQDNETWPEWVSNALSTCSFSSIHKASLSRLSRLSALFETRISLQFLSALKGYDELDIPLIGCYAPSVRVPVLKTYQDIVKTFLSLQAPPLSSFCHMQPSAPGSIFKLVVAYAALREQLLKLKGDEKKLTSSFFSITDQPFHHSGRQYLGTDSSGKVIPQLYKGGRLPRSARTNIGKIDLIGALKHSSNSYFSLLASDFLSNPKQLFSAATLLGYGQKTGLALPFEAIGRVPLDLETNPTGLYTTAIGQHTLLATPIQSTVMLSALATKRVVVPQILKLAIGPAVARTMVSDSLPISYQELMRAIGINSTIWVGVSSNVARHHIHIVKPRIKYAIPICNKEQEILFEGMKEAFELAVLDTHSFAHRKEMISALKAMRGSMVGKSSTAESFERLGINIGQKPFLYNHTWFGTIFFEDAIKFHSPNLVVLIFLRYGTFGKQAAPIAASVAAKWGEICRRHAGQASVKGIDR